MVADAVNRLYGVPKQIVTFQPELLCCVLFVNELYLNCLRVNRGAKRDQLVRFLESD